MKNKKYFDLYIFFSAFSRNLIEVFIGTILLKSGFVFKEVIYFFFLFNLFSLLLSVPFTFIAKKYSNRILALISAIFFGILQLVLANLKPIRGYLYLIAIIYAIYRRSYWMSRRFFVLEMTPNKDISKNYSIVSILNQIGIIAATYLGAFILDFVSVKILTIAAIILSFIGTFFLWKLKLPNNKKENKIEIINTIKKTPRLFIIRLGCYETISVISFLMPLYIFMYVKNTYSMIGFVNILVCLPTLVFTYLYGKVINDKKNYLKLSVFFIVMINILKVNTMGIFLFIVSFIEGFIKKMYEQSFYKEYLIMSKKYDYHNYNMMFEIFQNIFKMILSFILLVFINDLKVMIYITLFVVSLPLLFNTKDYNNKIFENIN